MIQYQNPIKGQESHWMRLDLSYLNSEISFVGKSRLWEDHEIEVMKCYRIWNPESILGLLI